MISRKKILIAAILLGASIVACRESIFGAPATTPGAAKWEHVQVVTYPSGLTGFFDTTSGRLFVYGADLKTPFMISEVQTLGEPLKVIKAPGQ